MADAVDTTMDAFDAASELDLDRTEDDRQFFAAKVVCRERIAAMDPAPSRGAGGDLNLDRKRRSFGRAPRRSGSPLVHDLHPATERRGELTQRR
jgi:hypothetical protein